MAYRRSGSQGQPPPGTTRAEVNRTELKRLVDAGRPPGLIGYRGKVPVGWVSMDREKTTRLARSPIMKPIDDQPVWSIVCFVVPTEYCGPRSRTGASCRCGRLRQEAWRQANRGLSRRQTESLERRFHVVWREVHTTRRFLRGGAAETAATNGSLKALVRSARGMESPIVGLTGGVLGDRILYPGTLGVRIGRSSGQHTHFLVASATKSMSSLW